MSFASKTAGSAAAVMGLTSQLNTLDFEGMDGSDDASECIDKLRALEELKASVAAAQVRVTATFAAGEQRRADECAAARASEPAPGESGSGGFEAWQARRDTDRCRPSVGAQVGLARRLSPHQGARQVGIATTLVQDLPRTLGALTSGVISEWRASIIVRESSSLTRADRRALDAEISTDLDRLASWGDKELTCQVRAVAYRLDAQAAVDRAARAMEDRRVSLRPAPDAMSLLGALLPVPAGVAVITSLEQAAATAHAQGDPRSRGQLMADTLTERVTGQTTATAVPVEVQVVISDRTLLGVDDSPAQVPGYGPIPAGTARELISPSDNNDTDDDSAKVWLRRLFAHPETGALIQVESTRRVFPRGMRRFITTRDGTCRTPWCEATIRHIDHIHDHAHGGRTTLSNGQGLCERCNYLKQTPGWKTEALPHERGRPHSVRVTTPTGHTYDSTAPPLLPGRRPPPAGQPEIYSHLEARIEYLLSA